MQTFFMSLLLGVSRALLSVVPIDLCVCHESMSESVRGDGIIPDASISISGCLQDTVVVDEKILKDNDFQLGVFDGQLRAREGNDRSD